MSYVETDVVGVRAWGRTVGAVTADPAAGAYAFEYDPDWAATGPQLAPLRMPNGPGVFVFPQLDRATYLGLPPLLADALPDRFGNALIDAWMAARGVAADRVTPLDRLAYTADRAMGALEFFPPVGDHPRRATAFELADLVEAARRALAGELRGDPDAEASLERLVEVGTSAGGARAKAVIAFNPTTYQIRSGQYEAPPGFEHWLLKFDGVDTDRSRETTFTSGRSYGIVEFAYHLMATAAGVEMSECRLLPEGPRTHFMTRRFDRTADGSKLHLLSLCGLAHLDFNAAGANGYEQYLQVVRELGLGPDALDQAFRRVVFNVAGVNRDDHTKNLAFLCDPTGRWSLAPAFDVSYAYNPAGAWTARHQMTVGGKAEGIGRADLEALADRFAVPGYPSVIDEVLTAVAGWSAFAEQAGLDEQRTEAIGADLARFRPV